MISVKQFVSDQVQQFSVETVRKVYQQSTEVASSGEIVITLLFCLCIFNLGCLTSHSLKIAALYRFMSYGLK